MADDRGLSHDYIDHIFSFHPPVDEATKELHEKVREACKIAAHDIKDLTPTCPEQTIAIRKIQEAMMHANAAIALNQ